MATPTNLPASFTTGAVLTAAQMNDLRGAFRILQVVQGTTTVQATNATQTFADTNLSATITPTATSSKVLVLITQADCYKSNGNTQNGLILRLMRGATDIYYGSFVSMFTDTALQNRATLSYHYLDSPATTSATTYKTQFRNFAAAAEVGVQIGSSSTSTLILLEVSA